MQKTLCLCVILFVVLGCATFGDNRKPYDTVDARVLIISKDISTYIGWTVIGEYGGVTSIYMTGVLEVRFGLFMGAPMYVMMPFNAGMVNDNTLLLVGNDYTVCAPTSDVIQEYLVMVEKVKELYKPPLGEIAEE